MELGIFSVSLTVKDLATSRSFYEKLDFEMVGGDQENYVILKNGGCIIGLFQGMFDKNILTFNPGWSGPHEESETFSDVRAIETKLRARGIHIESSNTSESEKGPANIMLTDPDGNGILLDQHRS